MVKIWSGGKWVEADSVTSHVCGACKGTGKGSFQGDPCFACSGMGTREGVDLAEQERTLGQSLAPVVLYTKPTNVHQRYANALLNDLDRNDPEHSQRLRRNRGLRDQYCNESWATLKANNRKNFREDAQAFITSVDDAARED